MARTLVAIYWNCDLFTAESHYARISKNRPIGQHFVKLGACLDHSGLGLPVVSFLFLRYPTVEIFDFLHSLGVTAGAISRFVLEIAATLCGSRPGVQSASPKTPKIQVFKGSPSPQGSHSPYIIGDTTRPRHTTYVQVWSKSDQRRLRKTLHKQTNRQTNQQTLRK